MGTKVNAAVSWAVAIAEDDSHGYDQTNRWGPDYDCSSLVIQAYENAGVPVKTNGASYTGNMVDVFITCGFQDVTSSITLSTGDGLIKGDVVWRSGHVEMVCASGQLVGASINENGETTGGETGDQTGAEIRVRSYYNYPWTTVLRYPESSGGSAPTTPISGNRYLTLAEMQNNALYIAWYLTNHGWTLNAIAGLLGNLQAESTINPGIWQNLDEGNSSLGYGLVQWTPSTKYTEWCSENGLEPSEMDSALLRILWELENNEQYYATSDYPETFSQFTQSTNTPYYLACAFAWNYERSWTVLYGSEEEQEALRQLRGGNAEYWYEYLLENDFSGGTTTITFKRRSGFKFVLFGRKTWRNTT